MKILQEINLDFAQDALPVFVFAKQYDRESRFIKIKPFNHGQLYKIESGVTARLRITKSDKTQVINDTIIEDGIINAELTAQALAVEGVAVADIGLYKDEALLSSQSFYINVRGAAYDQDKVNSSDEYGSLVDALAKVDNAIENCNTAVESAEKINISAEQTPTGADITVTDRNGEQTTVHVDTLFAVDSWADIRNAVRLGLGEKLFPPGYEFTTTDADTGIAVVWVVRGHNVHKAANEKLTYTMTLETKCVYSSSSGAYKGTMFDAIEALYYAPTGLAAGTYHFTLLSGFYTNRGGGKTYSFTLKKPVPAGGQITFPWLYNVDASTVKISTYSSPTSTQIIEGGITVTEGADGEDLGTADGNTENMNHTHRICYGSNNYAQSAIRQWLNSASPAGSYWKPTNKFDRPPSWANSYNGFMHTLPADFLEAVQTAAIPCCTNSVYETESLDGTQFDVNQSYTLEDKFFVLSRPEIYGTWDNRERKDGELLPYFEGLTNAEMLKRDASGTAIGCWMRTPDSVNAGSVRLMYTSGALTSSNAYYAYAIAAACIIA